MENQEKQANQEQQHKRRVRYSGTHPKTYKEKYKEHQPEKYADTIQKVISKGSTPAGMHISICVKEILDFLQIQPGQTGLDATLGYGGHTKAMLECLKGEGHIYALDVDPIESAKTKERLEKLGFGEEILTVRLQNFADIDQVSKETGKKFDFILADFSLFLLTDEPFFALLVLGLCPPLDRCFPIAFPAEPATREIPTEVALVRIDCFIVDPSSEVSLLNI